MRIPTIHLNGSSADSLKADIEVALEALRNASKALNGCQPNARDYYVQGAGASSEAIAEHIRRGDAIMKVIGELDAMYEGIVEQCDKRGNR